MGFDKSKDRETDKCIISYQFPIICHDIIRCNHYIVFVIELFML